MCKCNCRETEVCYNQSPVGQTNIAEAQSAASEVASATAVSGIAGSALSDQGSGTASGSVPGAAGGQLQMQQEVVQSE
eukprot:3878317-Amphidinium_carterae.1